MMSKRTKSEIHDLGVEYAAMKLIEQGVSTINNSKDNGIDLILDNKKTILVRAMSEELRMAIGVDDLNNLKSDYLVIISNLKFSTLRKICILSIDDVKKIAIDKPRKKNGISDYFINRNKYIKYRDNYNILME